MIDDAIYVYCNMTGHGETCVFPDIHSSQMPNIPFRKEADKNDWYSNLRGGFRVILYAIIQKKNRIYVNATIFETEGYKLFETSS